MAYWYFDTNAISKLNNLREKLGVEAIQRFLGKNHILITRRNYHELRMGNLESKRFIDLSEQFEIFQYEADLAIQNEVYYVNGCEPPTPHITRLEAEGIKFIVESKVLESMDGKVKADLGQRYLWKFLEDRKIITNEVIVVFGIYLGIARQTGDLGLELDLSKINYINYPSTYVSNFVYYFWFMKNANKVVVENDLYDLINSAAAPLVQRFYSEGSLIQALKSVKKCVPSKLPKALFRGRQKFPNLSIPDPENLNKKDFDVNVSMLENTELYRMNDLEKHIYEHVK